MRWNDLFEDLTGQLQAIEQAEQDIEIAERTRGELAQVTLMSRLRGAVGAQLSVSLGKAGDISGIVVRTGSDWLLIECPDEVLVRVEAIAVVRRLGERVVADDQAGRAALRLGVGSALRAIARDRGEMRIVHRDGTSMVGTPDRVGADFVDLVVHPVGEAPRSGQDRATVPFESIAMVRRTRSAWL